MEQLLDRCDNHITDKFCLTDYFFKSCKQKSDFRIGVEFEKLGVDATNFHAIKYFDERGAIGFLKQLQLLDNYQEIIEHGKILGLRGELGHITIEPGSQFEFSTKPFKHLHEVEQTFADFNKKTALIGKEFGVEWLGCGIHPLSTFEDIQMIPKARYDIMKSYLPTKGNKSSVMMTETAGTQVSIDYESEEDAMRKLRISLAISPILTAMFVNSPIRGGKLTKYKSYRASGWLDTDNERCGLISKKIFENDFKFIDYIDVILDVPMFFIEREKHLIDMTGITFREYLNHGAKGFKATMGDWFTHMTTFFPDVRMKNYIEIRNCDCQKSDLAMAFPALVKGIMYNEDALVKVEELIKDFSWEDLNELRIQAPAKGLDLEFKGVGMHEFAMELVSIAETSLQADNESIYLARIKELVSQRKTPADIIIEKWDSSWNQDVGKLVEYSKFE